MAVVLPRHLAGDPAQAETQPARASGCRQVDVAPERQGGSVPELPVELVLEAQRDGTDVEPVRARALSPSS